MTTRRFDQLESTVDELLGSDAWATAGNISNKLERRRRIEEMEEEKRLREELQEY